MPAPSEVISAAATENGLVQATLLAALIERSAYVVGPTEALADLTQASGLIYQAIISAATGYLYFYDAADSTTPDDGITCLVDGSGHRYHLASGSAVQLSSVLAEQNAPPGSPAEGDAYIVGTAPSGAWAAHATDIALYTRRGWVFAVPGIGQGLYNQATATNVQFDAAGDWVPFAAESTNIAPGALQFPAGLVVESTLNAPPGSPTAGQYWIVGGSPSGAFVGHSADLAYWTGSAWAFLDPAEGWTVFHKAFGFQVSFVSGAWLGGSGSDVQTFSTPGAFTWTKPAKGAMALLEMWGAGASGGRGRASPEGRGGGGGGGGAYVRLLIPLAELASTVSGSVGAGGASRTTNDTDGAAGGNTTFGGGYIAYGGGPANGYTSGGGGAGGGGAGVLGAGQTGIVNAPGGNGGGPSGGAGAADRTSPGADSGDGGGGGGAATGTSSGTGSAGGNSINGGGGGGGGAPNSSNSGAGGNSINGGAGGGGGGNGTAAGGASLRGGNGGAGGDGTTAASPGAQPGGGGGGSEGGNSGKGGDGRVRVTVW